MTQISELRPTDHLGVDPTEIERLFGLISEHFGENWLKQQYQHPLGAIWGRRDSLASTQLFFLGSALDWARERHIGWLKTQIKMIKGKDANNSRGAMLELLALYLIRNSGSEVTPTPKNTAGYDALVRFQDGNLVPISVKDYGMSQHERKFQVECKKFHAAFKSRLKSMAQTGTCVLIRASTYPSEDDWKALHKGLYEILNQSVGAPHTYELGNWSTRLVPPRLDVFPLSSREVSHQVIVISPFHYNEIRNLEAKLKDATDNAKKFANYGANALHAVFIRIPEWFQMQTAGLWVKDYFSRHPNGPIRFVLLYQGQAARSSEGTVLQHVCHIQGAEGYVEWPPQEQILRIDVPIGLVSQIGSQFQLNTDSQPLKDCYIYQKGDFFTSVSAGLDGAWRGNVRCIAPGVIQHSVFEFLGRRVQFSGKFPPVEEITIFG